MVIFRTLKEGDIPLIQKLALKAWLFTYKNIYTEKTIRKEVAKYYSDKSFRNYLSKTKQNKEFFGVAVDKNSILGYAHVGRKNNKWEIFRIYVSPDRLRQGLGTRLIHHIEVFLKSKKAKQYRVYSHLKNKIASNFYRKIGFKLNLSKNRGTTSICLEKRL